MIETKHERGTGRTRRTLEAALQEARAGRTVLVVFSSAMARTVASRALTDHVREAVKGLEFVTLLEVEKGHIRGRRFDRMFFDHTALEALAGRWMRGRFGELPAELTGGPLGSDFIG